VVKYGVTDNVEVCWGDSSGICRLKGCDWWVLETRLRSVLWVPAGNVWLLCLLIA
jgi:hypothetical protein